MAWSGGCIAGLIQCLVRGLGVGWVAVHRLRRIAAEGSISSTGAAHRITGGRTRRRVRTGLTARKRYSTCHQ